MVSNVARISSLRRSRSRTPARVATPQVSTRTARPRGRPRTPSRVVASTPKTKTPKTDKKSSKSAKKSVASISTSSAGKKRKSVLREDDDDEDDIDFPHPKKSRTPQSSKVQTRKHTPRKVTTHQQSPKPETSHARRSKRLQNLNSIREESKETTKASISSTSINGSIESSQSDANQSSKWSWFSCTVM